MQLRERRASAAVVDVEHLRKTYGRTVAAEDVSFTVEKAEIFGLLGSNGAGKTMSVESVVELRVPDAGAIRVFGLGPLVGLAALRECVGVNCRRAPRSKATSHRAVRSR